MKGILAALELIFWRFFMMLWPWMRWPKATAASLRGDFWAGLTGATLVLPQGIAFALIAGVPPRFGLYSAMIAAVIAALFGSSWHLVSGPTVALSVVLPTVLVPYAVVGSPDYIALSLLLMFLVGAIQLAFSVFRLGGLVNFISPTVVTGFTAGAGILIIFSQLPDFFGVQLPRGLPLLDRAVALAEALMWTHWPTLAQRRHTLVVYMGTLTAATLQRQLLAHGRAAQTPVAVISRGTCAEQQVRVGTGPGEFSPGELIKLALGTCNTLSADHRLAKALGDDFEANVIVATLKNEEEERYTDFDVQVIADLAALSPEQRDILTGRVEAAIERACTVGHTIEKGAGVRLHLLDDQD